MTKNSVLRNPFERIVWVVLISLSFLIFLERLHNFQEPWFTDVTFYATIGDEMNHGRFLYSDLWDQKPPAIYATYALAEKILGHTPYLLFFLGLFTSVGILLGLYKAGEALSGTPFGGLLAAVFWALLSNDLLLEADMPNNEFFINAGLIWAFALLVWRWKKGVPPLWVYCLVGILWAGAALYKEYMALDAVVVGLAYCFLVNGNKQRKSAIKGIGLAWVISLLIGASVMAYFYFVGRWADFWNAVYVYGRYYAGNIVENITSALKPETLFPHWGWYLLPLILLTVFALWMAFKNRHKWVWVYLAFLLIKFFEKAFPGRIRHHHYQLLIPALCLGAAWGISLIKDKYGKKVSWAVAGIVIVTLGLYEASWYLRPASDWSRQNYGFDYVGVDQVESEVNRYLKPGETFYEWSEFPRFYYGSGRRAPVGVLFGTYLFTQGDYAGGPMAASLTDRTLQQIQANQPELVILDQQWRPDGWDLHPMTVYIKSHYRVFSGYGINGRYEFLCRVGGALDQRLKAGMGGITTSLTGNS
jgi:hypothetical protein